MPEVRPHRVREQRMTDDIDVDCDSSDEHTLAWYRYVEGRLSFPFTARIIAVQSVSPLTRREKAGVVAMMHEDDCLAEIFALVDSSGR